MRGELYIAFKKAMAELMSERPGRTIAYDDCIVALNRIFEDVTAGQEKEKEKNE